jgi:putative transposase
MVEKPDEYRWSSYRANAYGVNNPIITPHALYMVLGKGSKQRATTTGKASKKPWTENSSMKYGPQSRQERHWEMSGSRQR